MTNGLAVGLEDHRRDIWNNGTCSSGYEFYGDVLSYVFKEFFEDNGVIWSEQMFKEYAHEQKLAVPEQLVWWGEE
jgi:hypothetical protein